MKTKSSTLILISLTAYVVYFLLRNKRLRTGYVPIRKLEHFFVRAASDEFFFLKKRVGVFSSNVYNNKHTLLSDMIGMI